jgi:carboxymethylenebutenolidase
MRCLFQREEEAEVMGQDVRLKSSDGKEIDGYLAEPKGTPKAGVVVIQEIFGVNHHIRAVTDRFAGDGYLALAPAMFDRLKPKVDLGYVAPDMQAGRELAMQLKPEQILADVQGAIDYLRKAGSKKVGIVGFCFGGTVAWRAASATNVDAAVGYYGGGVYAARELKPKVPTMLHFGDQDAGIPNDHVAEVAKLHPDVPVHIYHAGHGFHCDERSSFDAASAKQAYDRTLQFFAKHLS